MRVNGYRRYAATRRYIEHEYKQLLENSIMRMMTQFSNFRIVSNKAQASSILMVLLRRYFFLHLPDEDVSLVIFQDITAFQAKYIALCPNISILRFYYHLVHTQLTLLMPNDGTFRTNVSNICERRKRRNMIAIYIQYDIICII